MAISRWRGGRSLTTWSPIKTLPSVMSSRPAIIRRAVDFPQPEGPTKTTNSPSGISKFILSTATTSSPKTLVTSSRVTSAIPLPPSVYPERLRRPGSPHYLLVFPSLYLATFYLMPPRPAQAISLLDREQAPDGFLDPRARDLPGFDGVHHGIVSGGLLLRWTGDYEQIGPRLHSLDRSLGRRSSALRPRHRQIVGNDHTVEAEIPAQHAYCLSGEACRIMGVDGRVEEVPDHHHRHPRIDGGLERRQVVRLEGLRVVPYDGQAYVRVCGRCAVVWEVLGRRDYAGL